MKNTKHTPGPWKLWVARSSNPTIEIQCGERTPVVAWPGFDDSNRAKEIHIANARLIAAAPEMLEAAKLILQSTLAGKVSNQTRFEAAIQNLNQAYLKAGGD